MDEPFETKPSTGHGEQGIEEAAESKTKPLAIPIEFKILSSSSKRFNSSLPHFSVNFDEAEQSGDDSLFSIDSRTSSTIFGADTPPMLTDSKKEEKRTPLFSIALNGNKSNETLNSQESMTPGLIV